MPESQPNELIRITSLHTCHIYTSADVSLLARHRPSWRSARKDGVSVFAAGAGRFKGTGPWQAKQPVAKTSQGYDFNVALLLACAAFSYMCRVTRGGQAVFAGAPPAL